MQHWDYSVSTSDYYMAKFHHSMLNSDLCKLIFCAL